MYNFMTVPEDQLKKFLHEFGNISKVQRAINNKLSNSTVGKWLRDEVEIKEEFKLAIRSEMSKYFE